MKSRVAIICVNGIRTDLDRLTWTRKFNWWCDIHLKEKNVESERFEYRCSALFRFVGQRKRVDDLLRLVNLYKNDGRSIILVGHSNGNDIIARMLNLGERVDAIHCFAPAAFEADFARAIKAGMVKRMHIYGSKADSALQFAKCTQWLTQILSKCLSVLGVPPLGYGSLGLRGPAFAQSFPQVVEDHSIDTYDHGTWFDEEHFEDTMNSFATNYRNDQHPQPPTVRLP